MIELTLPIPPTDNRYYGKPKGARHKFLTKAGRVFRHEVAVAAVDQKARGLIQRRDRVGLRVLLHLPHGGDIFNRMKALGDALEYANVLVNDAQIDDGRVIRGHPVRDGRCEVTLWRI